MTKIALLSNINTDAVTRILQKDLTVFEPEGYGAELGMLMNPDSALYRFAPDMVFLLIDLFELLGHDTDEANARETIADYWERFTSSLHPDIIYFMSDAFLHGADAHVSGDLAMCATLESVWLDHLKKAMEQYPQIRLFPYHALVSRTGAEQFFSAKMWYLGRIPFSAKALPLIASEILRRVSVETRTPKKVLVLDLDNTLWGGLCGEQDQAPLVLSDEHAGLAFRDLQRVCKQMKAQGVLLAIVSKNNEEDALSVIEHHPQMILRKDDFCAMRINWQPKHENIRAIAEELNLSTDAFVFFDDSAQERDLVREMLPEVAVPDFPALPENLPAAMTGIYRDYFEKNVLTKEDVSRTEGYLANAKRQILREDAGDFDAWLKKLKIRLTRVSPLEHTDRIAQLFSKTNQFNLTTRRPDRSALETMMRDDHFRVLSYQVADRFGDLGLTAVLVLQLSGTDDGKGACFPVITDFLMSCRIMGRNIENAVIEDAERIVSAEGFTKLYARFQPTAKNKPVAALYGTLGYREVLTEADGTIVYEIRLSSAPKRPYAIIREGDA